MGGPKHGGGGRQKKHKCYEKRFRMTKRRYKMGAGRSKIHKDVDQIQDTIISIKQGTYKPEEVDIDKPGMGQFPCIICGRYFISKAVLMEHKRTRKHKKMRRKVTRPQYTIEEANRAGGEMREDTVYDKKRKAEILRKQEELKKSKSGPRFRQPSNVRFLTMDQ